MRVTIYNIIYCNRKQTALHKAAWYGYYSICEILVEAGASLSITDYQVVNGIVSSTVGVYSLWYTSKCNYCNEKHING